MLGIQMVHNAKNVLIMLLSAPEFVRFRYISRSSVTLYSCSVETTPCRLGVALLHVSHKKNNQTRQTGAVRPVSNGTDGTLVNQLLGMKQFLVKAGLFFCENGSNCFMAFPSAI